MYRIVQEALTNTLKHAGEPTGVRVTLCYERPYLAIEVYDDGHGAGDVGDVGRGGGDVGRGHGLTGMRERAAVYGGTVEAGPGPTGGWRVVTRVRVDDGPEPA